MERERRVGWLERSGRRPPAVCAAQSGGLPAGPARRQPGQRGPPAHRGEVEGVFRLHSMHSSFGKKQDTNSGSPFWSNFQFPSSGCCLNECLRLSIWHGHSYGTLSSRANVQVTMRTRYPCAFCLCFLALLCKGCPIPGIYLASTAPFPRRLRNVSQVALQDSYALRWVYVLHVPVQDFLGHSNQSREHASF